MEDQSVGISQGIISNMQCISRTTGIVPDIMHTVNLGIRVHLMVWVTSILKQHSRFEKFNHLKLIMHPYLSFAQFNKLYS